VSKMKCDQIISIACPLFRQKGTQGVSTEDIAQVCGISKATLFKLFESKQVLIERVVEKQLEKCEAMLAKQSELKTSHARISWLLDCSIQIGELFPAIFYCSLKRYYPGSFMLLDTFIESDLAGALLSALETGMDQSVFDPDLNHVRVVRMYLWQIKLAISDSTISEIDRVELYRQLKIFFISGIAANKSCI
jgi:AcrR family transcriptional regulator